MSKTDFVEVWVVRYLGYELNVCESKHEAEQLIADVWQSIVEGRNGYWDADDFDGLDENDEGTGFLNAISITSDWEV